MKEKLPTQSLLAYSYDRRKTSDRRISSYILTHCATSGLPLGYFPTKKISHVATISFHQLSLSDVRAAVTAAVDTDHGSSERIFCFFALMHKVPDRLLKFHTLQLRPAWNDPRLGALLSNNGLRNFAGFIEAIACFTERKFAEADFPSFTVSRSASHDSTDLRDFPSLLARWIAITETTISRERKAKPEEPISLRIFHRGRNAPRNVFAPTKSNGAELTEYAKILAKFYGRPYTLKWDQFIRNPSTQDSKVLRKLIQDVIACNISEDDDDFSDELQLSMQFRKWLEEAHLQAVQQEDAAARMHKVIKTENYSSILEGMTETSLSFLLNRSEEVDTVRNKPRREDFASFELYVNALSVWKRAERRTVSVQ